MAADRGRLMDVHMAAQRLRISESHVRVLCEMGELRHVRLSQRCIRIWEADLEQFLEDCTSGS